MHVHVVMCLLNLYVYVLFMAIVFGKQIDEEVIWTES